MIDPTDPNDIIYYNRTKEQLEEFILFCISVAGKNAITTSKILDKFLQPARYYNISPFDYIRSLSFDELTINLKNLGFGCYNNRAKYFRSIIDANLDLKNCSINDLEQVSGIGPKTARFFVLFSRPDVECAVIDTHILKFLKERGYIVPKSTPSGKKYLEIEQMFLNEARKQNLSIVEFDLLIWNQKAGYVNV